NLYTLDPGERESQGIELLPANLLDATRELESCEVLRNALGTVRDGDYVDYYISVKRREWQAAHEQITDWELKRYLQLF
ncbi:MAG: type III glutamate--ammonia ligase, partial [Solirubrobacteraceae bacterium]